jgi:hypothetical protein
VRGRWGEGRSAREARGQSEGPGVAIAIAISSHDPRAASFVRARASRSVPALAHLRPGLRDGVRVDLDPHAPRPARLRGGDAHPPVVAPEVVHRVRLGDAREREHLLHHLLRRRADRAQVVRVPRERARAFPARNRRRGRRRGGRRRRHRGHGAPLAMRGETRRDDRTKTTTTRTIPTNRKNRTRTSARDELQLHTRAPARREETRTPHGTHAIGNSEPRFLRYLSTRSLEFFFFFRTSRADSRIEGSNTVKGANLIRPRKRNSATYSPRQKILWALSLMSRARKRSPTPDLARAFCPRFSRALFASA